MHQVNPTTSNQRPATNFPLNNNKNKSTNEAGSLCSCDLVDSEEEENEIEQSGRPIQGQIPQSQRGKAKTVLVENNLRTASFPVRFFIQLSSQTAHMPCDFPIGVRAIFCQGGR